MNDSSLSHFVCGRYRPTPEQIPQILELLLPASVSTSTLQQTNSNT